MKYRYSATQWIYGNEPIETSMERLKKYGYNGIEFAAEPYSLDPARLNSLMVKYGLECSSLCGIYKPERNLSSSDPAVRKTALKYIYDSIDFAAAVKAPLLIVVPSSVGKLSPDESYEKAWGFAIASIKEAASYAQEKNVSLAVEAINRYETFLLSNLTMALKFVDEIGHPSVGLMADLFHMNLEERNIEASLKTIKEKLLHVHVADNTREAAGLGSTNFKPVLETLQTISYKGWLTMEFMPAVSDPYSVGKAEQSTNLLDEFTKQSIQYLKGL